METGSKGAVGKKKKETARGGKANRESDRKTRQKEVRGRNEKRECARSGSRINIDSSNFSFHLASIMTDALTRDKRACAKMRRGWMKRDEYIFN